MGVDRDYLVLGLVVAVVVVGAVLALIQPSGSAPGSQGNTVAQSGGLSCRYVYPWVPQVNVSVINQVRESLGEKPLVWSQCLATFAFLRSQFLVSYWESTGYIGHFFLPQNITQFFIGNGTVYEDMYFIPTTLGVLSVVHHYVLNYTGMSVSVYVSVVNNTFIVSVNGTQYSVSLAQLPYNQSAQLMLLFADPGHAYPLLNPNVAYIGGYVQTVVNNMGSCQWVVKYEIAYCTPTQQANTWIVGVFEIG